MTNYQHVSTQLSEYHATCLQELVNKVNRTLTTSFESWLLDDVSGEGEVVALMTLLMEARILANALLISDSARPAIEEDSADVV